MCVVHHTYLPDEHRIEMIGRRYGIKEDALIEILRTYEGFRRAELEVLAFDIANQDPKEFNGLVEVRERRREILQKVCEDYGITADDAREIYVAVKGRDVEL